MELTIYGYPKCSTSTDAQKWLRAHGHQTAMYDMFAEAPPKETLRELIGRSGLALRKFYNVNGDKYKELGLKDKLGAMSSEEQLDLLASDGRLIKRPIVTRSDGKGPVTVGFKPAEYETAWVGK
ncbi:Spx/MgsR family RNA polymerase-binding regulatory protein [Paenibacillus cymbidii]|uniref:Spx/MgsR family RNA polymerase-binding regulatory protein n=1 Tax=Paenibacillus cymbidii TaxID=1639034 RepID=UPI001080DDAB|nr:Spx/MgsR family RNA polymerase-binding regulatory protein [Paenibacillus cymbidii]